MRKLLTLLAFMAACLFVAQSTLAATAPYSTCCLAGCKGMTHCVNQPCQACEALPVLDLAVPRHAFMAAAQEHVDQEVSCAAGPTEEIWHPPD